jgi:hypothetical protein
MNGHRQASAKDLEKLEVWPPVHARALLTGGRGLRIEHRLRNPDGDLLQRSPSADRGRSHRLCRCNRRDVLAIIAHRTTSLPERTVYAL